LSRVGRISRAAGTILAATLLTAGGLAPATLAVGPDKAEVVLVFDFSGSILDDATTRNQFGAALERVADRVDETQGDLIKGETTVSIVQFASKAADLQRCNDIKLLGSPSTVRRFADCLRTIAASYRKGLDPALEKVIGRDTNYVAAMEQAAAHLPANAVRPTMILFTDGKHDVAGVPVSQVEPERDRLFGSRSPFALLPVGMGLDPAQRPQLEAGLISLQTINEMPPCSTGSTFEWPQTVFESPDDAGNAVAVALQNATCTFTASAAQPSGPPPAATVRDIALTPLDGRIEVSWSAPTRTTDPVMDYKVRCSAGGNDPIESKEGVTTETTAVVEGLTNGTEYRCEVAAVTATSEGEWTEAGASATPQLAPATPGKPSVAPLDGAVGISVKPQPSSVTSVHYECSADNGKTWSRAADADGSGDTSAQVVGLTNGATYVCRAFAANTTGTSAASPLSDAVRPCSSFLECNGLSLPVVATVIGVILGALLLGLYFLLRNRGGGYTVAVVDVLHTANLGGGGSLGIRFEREGREVTGIAAAKGSKADVRIQKLRGDRYRVKDKYATHETTSGEPVVITDTGIRHELVLRSFEGKAASTASARR
jgi:hypothetical protein